MEWTKPREGPPPTEDREKIPVGIHDIFVKDVRTGSRANGPFKSQRGEPAIMLILSDNQGREATKWINLNSSGAWWLQEIVTAAGEPQRLHSWESRGIGLESFADSLFATNELNGLRFRAEVKLAKNPKYLDIIPIRRAPDEALPPEPEPVPEPPPAEEPPPAPPVDDWTEDRAWRAVLAKWAPDEKDARNDMWHRAISNVGKSRADFTSADWEQVAAAVSKKAVPF